jgi:tetratricopeptide (TPR) repeat protein
MARALPASNLIAPARTALVLAIVALLAAAPAWAQVAPADDDATADPGDADQWLRVGLERYERGNLVGAIEAFERGFAHEPRPVFLFAIAQAHRKRGDCARARSAYDAFLATRPSEAQATAAREQRGRCADAAPPAIAPAVTASASSPAPSSLPSSSPTPSSPGSRWSDRTTVVAAGASVALAAVSAALWLSARGAADGARDADSYDRYRTLRERAETRQRLASATAGAAVVAGAVAIWRLGRDRPERSERSDRPDRPDRSARARRTERALARTAWRPLVDVSTAAVGITVDGAW